MHKVLVHNSNLDDVFFVSKFLQGLNPEIRAIIALHKPRTVDALLSLALMQASILEAQPRQFYWRNGRDFNRNQGRAQPIPQPGIMGPIPNQADEIKPKWDDKLSALRAQRRAQGLCMKCGEKWGKHHKCPDKISIHVLEEILEVMQSDQTQEDSSESSSDEEEAFCLSQCVVSRVQGKKTVKLSGMVNKQEILILIDFGSSCSFLCEKTAEQLKCARVPIPPMKVTVANGQQITSDKQVSNFTWWAQGHTFIHSVRILPISCFDLVLGMNWLKKHSPMWIHWKRKLLRFSYEGARISLKGIKDSTSSCIKIKTKKLKGLVKKWGVAQVVHLCLVSTTCSAVNIPPEIQQLVEQNSELFQDPQILPPSREFDHKIPLIPGVKPVNVKPYRYSPTQKDEIERQITEMLHKGIIRPSHSPFASPVILVKKDGSWRFCVDYR